MKISESWLREWVSPSLSTQQIADRLTMAGLEVDAIESAGELLQGVVVGEILAAEPHPNADKLQICKVAGQGDPVQVVCGAANARVGIKIPFATIGAVLPENFVIKKAKLRDVDSFGMLCGADELGIDIPGDGLWELHQEAVVGQSINQYLSLDDNIIELDLTPNRSDCLSIKGVARELATLEKLDVRSPTIDAQAPLIDDVVAVTIDTAQECPRYCSRVIKAVDLTQPSPVWLAERLRRAGVASKNIAVDVTNYVLLEIGQPMHAFDLAKVQGPMTVRFASQGEQLELLNQETVTLQPASLVIADASGPLALAGVMGGLASAVTDGTQDILLESAFFAPEAIAGKAREYGLHTDSSHRFERGVDYALQVQAIERATALITAVAGGQPGPVVEQTTEHVPVDSTVVLTLANVQRHLGCVIDRDECLDILGRLGLQIVKETDQAVTFSVPSYRFDITIEADLIEEIARVYGYDRLPSQPLEAFLSVPKSTETRLNLHLLRNRLVARGYREVITYSFVDPEIQLALHSGEAPVDVRNPISADMSQMRTSLWPGLLSAASRNIKRQQPRIRFFEAGLRFAVEQGKLTQQAMISGLATGQNLPENWCNAKDLLDFYDVKNDVTALAGHIDVRALSFTKAQRKGLHPGQTAAITVDDKEIGFIGALHPELQKQLGFSHPVFLFELTQDALLAHNVASFESLSTSPEARRDIAMTVDKNTSVGDIEKQVISVAGDYLINLKVFDVYAGEGIDPHRKSVALGLTFQDKSRTLTEDEITTAISKVTQSLEACFDAVLR